jgi:hypothetical protein
MENTRVFSLIDNMVQLERYYGSCYWLLHQLQCLYANAFGFAVDERSPRSNARHKAFLDNCSTISNKISTAPMMQASGLTKLLPKGNLAPSAPLPSSPL